VPAPEAVAIYAFIRFESEHPFCIVDENTIFSAVGLQQQYQLSYWDAAILAAAHELNSRIVYSENLKHEQFYGEVQVINPFLAPKT
jgi:predicted nucleic acid-binding protein